MKIGGYLGLSTIDYPGKLAAVVFTQGCNYRCLYCHNAGLIPFEGNENVESKYVIDILEKRKVVLEGVVVTGGEPTLQEDLLPFMYLLKSLGYDVKLDTNGSKPEVVNELVSYDLVDYVAIDFKSWKTGYEKLSGDIHALEQVLRSIDLVFRHNVPMEIRTSCDKRFINVDVIRTMSTVIKEYPKLPWFLQKVRSPGKPYSDLDKLVETAKENVDFVCCRN